MELARTGLKENIRQFTLLLLVNGFVGGMMGLERSILPSLAEKEFDLAGHTALLSFIVVFGLVKALSNFMSGKLANRFGRKKLLVAGWVVAIPIPLMLMFAESWNMIIAANVLLGINQGLAWSSTVVMKIDLVGEKHRGFAMGLNEFAGYLSLSMVALLSGYLAGRYGLRPYPFYIGVVLVILGLGFSLFLIKDTLGHLKLEAESSTISPMKNVFWETSWKNPILGTVTQAGLINNLNDGMVWGVLPILLARKGFPLEQIGLITALYPAVWGFGQVLTGRLADRFNKKRLMFWGMVVQGLAILLFLYAETAIDFSLLSVALGWGTAMVYPTFLVTLAENTHPLDRANSIGIYRLWRDLGYAIGALLTGIIADQFGLESSVVLVGMLTLGSALIIQKRMDQRKNLKTKTNL